MKGTLHKTEIGWVVRWPQEDPRDPLPELLLHPEYQTILPLDLDLEGNEVEFDWCVIVEHYTGKGKEYAKLIQPREKASNKSWEGCDGCTEQDEVMYKNGYVKGYNAAIAELPKEISDDRTKLHWKTSLVVHIPEISDEEIEKSAKEWYDKKGIVNYKAEIRAWVSACKWYREQLKKTSI